MSAELEVLEKLLPDLPSAVERRQIGEILTKTIQALNDSDYQIQRLSAVVQIARETEFSSLPNQAVALNELIDAGKYAAETMLTAENPEKLQSVQELYKEFCDELKSVDRLLRSNWSRIVDRDFAPLSAIGTLLQRIDKTSDLGRRLAACGHEAEQLAARMAPPDVLRDSITRLHKQRKELEAERTSVTKDPEVDKFLDALVNANATLQMVTGHVHNWLKENDALDRFAITPRS